MKTVVTVVNKGTRFWLKGTTWAFSLDRADRFDSADLAYTAIEKAKIFNQKTLMKRAEVWSEDMAIKETSFI